MDTELKVPLTSEQQEKEDRKEARERSAKLIGDLNARNKESLRSGNERLGWHVGLGDHEVFILSQPVDVPSPVFNEFRKETDVLTNRYYVMITRYGIRAIRLLKGEMAPDGQTSLTIAPARETIPAVFEGDSEPINVEAKNADGSTRYVKVPDYTTLDNRYSCGEQYLLDCLQNGQEKWENGHGELKFYQKYTSDGSDGHLPGNQAWRLVDDNISPEQGGDVNLRDGLYSGYFRGFDHDEGTGQESFSMKGYDSSHYLVGNVHANIGGIIEDIPSGVVEKALAKSKEKANERRIIPTISAKKQLDLLQNLEKGLSD